MSGSFQPGDYTGNRAAGQASNRGQLAAGHRLVLAQQIEALVVCWAQPQALRDRMVKQHHRSAVPTHQPSDDLVGQVMLVLAYRFRLIRFHNRLVNKLTGKEYAVKPAVRGLYFAE